MFKYTKKEINEIARKANFDINTCEKVLRLSSILDFFKQVKLVPSLSLKVAQQSIYFCSTYHDSVLISI